MKDRKSRRILIKAAVSACAMFLCYGFLMHSSFRTGKATAASTGPSPSFTGAPNESNCTTCHSTFAVNSGGGNVVISGIPRNYLPGQAIPVRVTVNDTTGVLFVLADSRFNDGDRAGSLTPTPARRDHAD